MPPSGVAQSRWHGGTVRRRQARPRQHLFDVAKALYGPGSDLAARWGKARRDRLDQGRPDLVMEELARHAHADRCGEAERNAAHFRTNRARMDYPRFRERNLCVPTGVVEGARRSVTAGRLKRGGMHRSVDGANAVTALRRSVHGNRFDDFWERRAGWDRGARTNLPCTRWIGTRDFPISVVNVSSVVRTGYRGDGPCPGNCVRRGVV